MDILWQYNNACLFYSWKWDRKKEYLFTGHSQKGAKDKKCVLLTGCNLQLPKPIKQDLAYLKYLSE